MEPDAGKGRQVLGDGGREGADDRNDEVHVYRHSGIQERRGTVPVWLLLVAIGLLIWSVYYTVRYWTPG